jgi:hypothetical protein
VGLTGPGRFLSVSRLGWKVDTGTWANTRKNCLLIAATRGPKCLARDSLRESWRDFWTLACLTTLWGGASMSIGRRCDRCDRLRSPEFSVKGGGAMKDMGVLLFLGLMGLTTAAMSQNVFTGTWRPDPQVFSPTRKPDVIELANSIYECRSCSPPSK